MLYRKTLLSIFFTALSSYVFAQNSSISGIVKDSTTTISGASVVLKNTKTGITTDSKGYFELTNLVKGAYTIQISYLGYIAESRRITLKEGEKLNINFSLKRDLRLLNDVAIDAKTKTREIKESGFSVNAIETKKFANTTADLNQILNRSTGVRIREQGGLGSDFKFSINGLSGKQVKFFIDGIPMDVMGSAMSLNNIPVNLAERLEVYKGVVPVQLGTNGPICS
jgi:outer membrane receptor protein involved in Fe transport